MCGADNKKPIPIIEFRLTYRCNYKCGYCYQSNMRSKNNNADCLDASNEVVDGFIDFISNLKKQYTIRLVGGETCIHPRFLDVVKAITDNNHNFSIVTNFSYPNNFFKKIIDFQKKGKINIEVSLHQSQVKLDDFYEKIKEFKTYINGKNVFLQVNTVVTEENFEQVKQIDKKLNEMDIYLKIQKLTVNGKRVYYTDEIENYFNKFKPEEKELDLRNYNTFGTICHAGFVSALVELNGNIKRCYNYNYALNDLGNVTKKSSIKLLEKPEPCLACYCVCPVPAIHNLIEINHRNKARAYFIKNMSVSNPVSRFLKMYLGGVLS